ncbi:hypothetical protein C3B78_03675 [Arthrobacter sp. PGP41]|uniref:hypothetical protein n=1 Tax=unclassified Arthrobacter TaxID=235627 RepID=UPI000CDCBD51|nr:MULTISPECIES: hypothetical protein [unclassified Arthrobacter]AUZ33656.1 hypothetical protein C3B78_03675 [Arthrobacter sp. PGP41]MDT0197438.1 hypothetical protein [Arthrobacter sp. AB6]
MLADILLRLRTWLISTFAYETGGQAADAMADAARWGWLPALSGVAVGGDHARRSHGESLAKRAEMSG